MGLHGTMAPGTGAPPAKSIALSIVSMARDSSDLTWSDPSDPCKSPPRVWSASELATGVAPVAE